MTVSRFALVPAAGSGSRLGAGTPKQYLALAGQPMLFHSVAALACSPAVDRVYVVLAAQDRTFTSIDWGPLASRVVPLWCGGATRAATVFNGLMAARDDIDPADWVLVHDAARPCLDPASLERLVTELDDDAVGGLLAVPVADTVKRDDGAGRVRATEARDGLWRAQTPQMFRAGLLAQALHEAGPDAVTDEAAAIERLGLAPRLVPGDGWNIKVTYPEDLTLAEAILMRRRTLDARSAGT